MKGINPWNKYKKKLKREKFKCKFRKVFAIDFESESEEWEKREKLFPVSYAMLLLQVFFSC